MRAIQLIFEQIVCLEIQGKGQVLALLKNMNANINGTTSHDSPDNTPFRSGYALGYTDNRGRKAIDTNLYAFGDKDGFVVNFITTGLGVIPEISYNREKKMVESYGLNHLMILMFIIKSQLQHLHGVHLR